MMPKYVTLALSDLERANRIHDVIHDTEIFAIGNTELLHERAVGVCGSRDASAEGLRFAESFGQKAALAGLIVVSGYARGVDRMAHKGALSADGGTIAVLPQGILSFRLVAELEPLISFSRNFLAISMFHPRAGWQAWQAMERNKLIVGLSDGILAVDAKRDSGTLNSALESVRQGKPLWAFHHPDESNDSMGVRGPLADVARQLETSDNVGEILSQIKSGAKFMAGQLNFGLR